MEDLLKEFWPVALFFVISIVSYVRNDAKMKQGKKEGQQMQPHTLDENFPEVEIVEPPFTPYSQTKKTLPSFGDKCVKEKSPSSGSVNSLKAPVAERGAKVALKGKSDIKKAFIYSEILNRKY